MELDTCMTKWPSRKSGMKVPPTKGSAASAATTRPAESRRHLEMGCRRRCTGGVLPCFEARQPRGFGPRVMAAQQQRAQRRRGGHRHQQAKPDTAKMKASAKRADEVSLHAGGEQLRQEHRDDHRRGVDDRAAHFERSVAHHLEPRLRVRRGACSRASRRRMFSMPMMASSTSTPARRRSRPSVMVLSVRPMRSSTATAASSDSGMAVKAIRAARKSRRNRYSTARMSTAAITSEFFRFPSARSMKLAGRCRPE